MKNSIFISYRRDDSSGYTQALFTELKQQFGADRVFLDVDDIRGGDDFIETIERAGYKTRVLLAIIGTKWLDVESAEGERRLDDPDDYVRAEIRAALDRGVRVIPVLVDGATVPPAQYLPDDLQPLTRRNAVEIRHARFQDDVRHLATDLRRSLGLKDRLSEHFTKLVNQSLKRWAWIGSALVLVGIYLIVQVERPIGLADVFSVLAEQGYVANTGFSGNYQPGNIVRTFEEGPDGGERQLATPVIFVWAQDCFPEQTPHSSEYVIPVSASTPSAQFALEADALRRWIPALNISSSAASAYSVEFENTRVLTFALGDLSGEFSQACVDALSAAIAAGDEADWFSVVVESIVADGLSLQVQWQSDLTAEVRASATEHATNVLSKLTPADEAPTEMASVRIVTADQVRTVISAKGPLIVAYRARPIQPRFGN